MGRARRAETKMRTMDCAKSGEISETAKGPVKSPAFIISENDYQCFLNYTTKAERLVSERNHEAAKLESVKKATYEMSKNWDNTLKNIAKRRREELLSKKQRREEEKKILDQEIRERKIAEQEEIVGRARELLLYRWPLCRKINSALRASECHRELEAQIAFRRTLREMDTKCEEEYFRTIKEDVARFQAEEQLKNEANRATQLKFGAELKKQISDSEADARKQREREMAAERRDQENMSKELKLIRDCETELAFKRKNQLRQQFQDAITEKELYQKELKREEDFQRHAAELYNRSHARIKQIHRANERELKDFEACKAERTGEKFKELLKTRVRYGDDIIEKNAMEKEAIERERREEAKSREKAVRAEMKKCEEEAAIEREKQLREEKELKAWELMQRLKKDEYNKSVAFEQRKREWTKKNEYANALRRDIVEKEAERKREKLFEELALRSNTEKANQAMLAYGNKVMEESKGVRPLFPILKAVEDLKKELGV